MAKQELIKAAKNLKNVNVIPKPSPDMAFQAFKMLADAHHEYRMTVQAETTKREAIHAWRDINVGKIEVWLILRCLFCSSQLIFVGFLC